MKITIKNFKSIGLLVDYELKPLTILSGTNSSGKSSFIQLLLLLKQTIDIDSSNQPLYIDGKFYTVRDFIDIIKNKNKDNKLEIGFTVNKAEFDLYRDRVERSIFDSFPDYECQLKIVFDFDDTNLYIKEFFLIYKTSEKENYVRFFEDKHTPTNSIVESNNEYFTKGYYDSETTFSKISYSAIFPNTYEIIHIDKIANPKGGEPLINKTVSNEYPNLASIKSFFKTYFGELFYIGPLRFEPKDSYPSSNDTTNVGIRGENVAQILEKRKNERTLVLLPNFNEDGLTFEERQMSLLEATNYWVCNVFKFGKQMFAKESGENYSIILINNNDVPATIKHVGFGVSQILPIIVQGLILPSGGTLVLEQPEIHLHPRIQSLLFDFLFSLILQQKRIIIETHSDHFITRLRRRVAEENDNKLNDLVNLTFIENNADDVTFRSIKLDEFGALTYFPEEFIERPDIELKALIKAQMKKRINNTIKE